MHKTFSLSVSNGICSSSDDRFSLNTPTSRIKAQEKHLVGWLVSQVQKDTVNLLLKYNKASAISRTFLGPALYDVLLLGSMESFPRRICFKVFFN